MADEREELLNQQIAELEEQTAVIAERLEEVMGVDCNFGACIFDPAMTNIEEKLAAVQKRKANMEKIIKDLKACET
jgi:chaperonin cofactor prefoldin